MEHHEARLVDPKEAGPGLDESPQLGIDDRGQVGEQGRAVAIGPAPIPEGMASV
jgi:hypothetical protein